MTSIQAIAENCKMQLELRKAQEQLLKQPTYFTTGIWLQLVV